MMDAQTNSSEGGRHACGKCFTSFPTPDLLQSHCLSCFGEPGSNPESSTPSQGSPEHDDETLENMEVNFSQGDQMGPLDSPNSDTVTLEIGSLSHPAFDPNVAKNNEPGGRCIQIIQGKKIMECTTCEKRFTNYNSFKRHRRMHVSGATHHCDICGKFFYRRYLWKNHMEKTHGCEISDAKNVKSSSKIEDEDLSKNNGQQSYLCYVCKEVFSTRSELSMHQSKAHSITQVAFPVYKGDTEVVLHESFSKQNNHAYHQRNTDNWETSASDGMPEHMVSNKFDVMSTRSSPGPLPESMKDSSPYNSSLDGLKFDNTNGSPAISIELSDSEGDEAIDDIDSAAPPGAEDGHSCSTLKCIPCKKSFKDEESLNNHKQRHLGNTVHECRYCCLSFFRYDSLLTHMKKHEGQKEMFVCHICNYEGFDADQLKIHFNSIHTSLKNKPKIMKHTEHGEVDDEEGVVLITSKSDSNNFSLSSEQPSSKVSLNGVSIISVPSESFSCKVCHAVFHDEKLCHSHVKKHSQMQCNFCGKAFVDSVKLFDHQTNDHNSKIKACYICLASFHSVQDLKTHVALHQDKASIDLSPRLMNQALSRKVVHAAGQNADSLLRVKESNLKSNSLTLFPSESKVDDDSSIILFKKTTVPSSNNQSAISVTLKPVESLNKSTPDFKKDSDVPKSTRNHTCIHCGENFPRQELFQRHMIRAHVFNKIPTKTTSIQHKISALKSTSRKQIMLGSSDEPNDLNNRNSLKKTFFKSDSGMENKSRENVMGSTIDKPSPLAMLTNLIDSTNRQSSVTAPRKNNIFRCTYCVKSFPVLAQLNYHLSEHFIPYNCEYCWMPFSDKIKMVSHINGVHGRSKRYYCYGCCATVGNSVELQAHMNQCRGPPVVDVNPIPAPPVQQSFGTYKECKTCHKKFVNEKRLMNHSCISGSEGLWVCEICNASFPQSSHLASHQQQTHKSEEVFRCDVCGLTGNKDFVITHMITVHMTQVSGPFPQASKPDNHFENQSAMTITAVPSTMMHQKSYLKHQGAEVKIYNQPKRVKISSSMRLPEGFVGYQQRPPVHIGPHSVLDRNDNMIKVPSEHDFCHMCEKMFPSAEFPEHMLREHCSGVKVMPSNEAESFKRPVDANEEKNVIEIITKDEPSFERNVQLVR